MTVTHSNYFQELADEAELRIRGRFTGPASASVLRLDSCQPADSPGTLAVCDDDSSSHVVGWCQDLPAI